MKVDRAIEIALQYREILLEIMESGVFEEKYDEIVGKALQDTRDIMKFIPRRNYNSPVYKNFRTGIEGIDDW